MRVGDRGEFELVTPDHCLITPKVDDILGKTKCVVRFEHNSMNRAYWETQRAIFEGINTEGLVDDKAISLVGVYEVVGTESAFGSTMFLVKPFDVVGYERKVAERDVAARDRAKARLRELLPKLKCSVAKAETPQGMTGRWFRVSVKNPNLQSFDKVTVRLTAKGKTGRTTVKNVSGMKTRSRLIQWKHPGTPKATVDIDAMLGPAPTSQPTSKPAKP